MSDCDRNICYTQDYNGGCATCPCNTDVPDTNDGEITKAQAIEALKTLKTYCDQYLREDGVVADYTRSCDGCPLCDWCCHDRECLTPDDWQIPQERTEE